MKNVKKLMRKTMGIVLCAALALGCILGGSTIAWAESEMADTTTKTAPIEERVKIPHTQQSGETNYFTFAEGKWETGNEEHTWSKKVDAEHPEATYYEVKFTGHKIDIYAGKNRMM